MASTTAAELEPGPAVFYGVREGWAHLWQQAKREGRDWYYIDNAYYDVARETYFRVTKNAIQHTGLGVSDGKRFAALGMKIKPFRDGDYVLVCRQSDEFMRVVAGDPGFYDGITANLRRVGKKVVVRCKGESRPFAKDLAHADMLVTWSSTAAVMAILDGITVSCAPQCCATNAGGFRGRGQWASVLADNEWTAEEMADGTAWASLQ